MVRIRIDGRRRRTSSGARRSRGAATRRRSSGAIGSISRRPTTAASDRSILGFRRSDGKQLWETFVPQRDIESGHPKNSHASATPVTDGAPRLRVVRQPRPARGRSRTARSPGTARRPARELSRQRRLARPLQGSPLHLSGPRRHRRRRLVRRRVRDRDRQAAVADAARRERRLGHAGRDQRQRPRRADRQQPAPRAGLRSGDRQGALVGRRQYVRSHSDAGRRPRPRVLRVGPRGPDDGDPPRRQRRRHLDARRLVGREGIAVRAVADARRRRAVSRQRHAEHRHRVRSEDRRRCCSRAGSGRSGARASRRRRSR